MLRVMALTSVAALALLGNSALAAGSPPAAAAPASYSWNGFYVGINGGGGWGHSRMIYIDPSVPDSSHDTGSVNDVSHETSGGLIGGTVGFNYEAPSNLMFGVEVDEDWTHLSGQASCPSPVFKCATNISNLGTARARLGYAWDELLMYGTAGLAWGDVKARTIDTAGGSIPPSGTPINGSSSMRVGWAIGLGGEFPVWENMSVKAEWVYFSLSRHVYGVDFGIPVEVHPEGNLFRVGLNWHFDTGEIL